MDNLRKKTALSLVMAVIIFIFIFFYGLREPARQEAATLRIQQESIQNGKNTFLTTCGSCHGQQAQGGVGPALGGKDATLVQRTVRSGKGIMPAFSPNQISDGDLEDITLFLGNLPSSPTVSSQTTPVVTALPPTTSPSPTSAAPATPNTPKAGDLLSRGEELYQRAAGGVGCAGCHGVDAYGSIGPNIRGSSAQEIADALKTAAMMNFLKMTDDEIAAVSAYLKYLESQR